MANLNWARAPHYTSDPARVVDGGDYGILSDAKAGRKGSPPRKAKKKKAVVASSNKALKNQGALQTKKQKAKAGKSNPKKAVVQKTKVIVRPTINQQMSFLQKIIADRQTTIAKLIVELESAERGLATLQASMPIKSHA